MLGTLAKWLRIMGYDVILADNDVDDIRILEMLEEEGGRILLTRDKMLANRAASAGVSAILLRSDSLYGQISELLDSVEIDATRLFTRCPHCGALLDAVSKDEAGKSGMVPDGSLENSEKFWKCPSCGRYYWKGSHWPKIIEHLKKWGIDVDEAFYS